MADYAQAAAELLRAVRGKRSQVAFARRLGYAGNPITDWENKRRRPTASDAFRAAQLAKLDVLGAFKKFHPSAPPEPIGDSWPLAQWLSGIRGGASIRELAERCGRSRYTVSRWLNGATEPKLDEFLTFLDALTGRAHDLVANLVPIEQVPSLKERHRQAASARALAFKLPWTEVLLRVLETEHYKAAAVGGAKFLSDILGIPVSDVECCVRGLLEAGVVQTNDNHYEVIGNLSVDTRSSVEGMYELQRHWLGVAQARVGRDGNWFAYNAISVSAEDLDRIQLKLRETFREIRGMVATSAPTESAALLVMNLLRFHTHCEGSTGG